MLSSVRAGEPAPINATTKGVVMWYIVTWTNHLNEKKTRDYSCPDDLNEFLGTLLVNGYDFSVQSFKAYQQ